LTLQYVIGYIDLDFTKDCSAFIFKTKPS